MDTRFLTKNQKKKKKKKKNIYIYIYIYDGKKKTSSINGAVLICSLYVEK